MTHICFGELTIIGSDNDLSPGRRQATIWTNAGVSLMGPLRTNFSEILIAIQIFSLKKIRLKMSSAKCCPFNLSLNVLICPIHPYPIQQAQGFSCCALFCPHHNNASPPGQAGLDFADDSFRGIFVNEKFLILIKTSLKFVPKGPIDNNSALV